MRPCVLPRGWTASKLSAYSNDLLGPEGCRGLASGGAVVTCSSNGAVAEGVELRDDPANGIYPSSLVADA